MRADIVLIAGVGLLGAYAVYRMTKASSAANPLTPPDRGATPTPLVIPTGALPELPGAIPAAPPEVAIVNGDPLKLQGGAWYQGRIETNPASGALSESSTREQIATYLSSLGFQDIGPGSALPPSRVFMTPQEASTDIFQAFALASPGTGTRWFRARYPAFDAVSGNPIPTSLARPKGLVAIWKAAPPSNTISVSGYYQRQKMYPQIMWMPMPRGPR